MTGVQTCALPIYTEETIERRLGKAEYEMGFADRFDKVVINDNLDDAVADVDSLIRDFAGIEPS